MNIYQENGFKDRRAYLQSLAEEYGAAKVRALLSVLPASEDFDGLVTALEDSEGDDYGDE